MTAPAVYSAYQYGEAARCSKTARLSSLTLPAYPTLQKHFVNDKLGASHLSRKRHVS